MRTQQEIETIFKKFQWNTEPYPAVHAEWIELDHLMSQLLSELLEREIKAETVREDYYCWSVSITETPLSMEEVEMLFTIANADDYERDANDFGVYPITELTQGLCSKLVSRTLPFYADTSFADDEGVWFVRVMMHTDEEALSSEGVISFGEKAG